MRSGEDQVLERLTGLGFSEADARTLADALPRRGAARQAGPRPLAGRVAGPAFPDLDPARAARAARCTSPATSAGTGTARSATSRSRRSSRRSSPRRRPSAHARRGAALLPDRDARLLGAQARRRAASSRALTATSPPRLGHPDGGPKLAGTNPLAIAIPSSDGRAARRGRLDGRRHLRRRDRGSGDARTSSSRSAASTRTRPSRSRSGSSCWSTRWSPSPATARCCSSPGPRPTRCPRYEPAPSASACPVIARSAGRRSSDAKSSSLRARTSRPRLGVELGRALELVERSVRVPEPHLEAGVVVVALPGVRIGRDPGLELGARALRVALRPAARRPRTTTPSRTAGRPRPASRRSRAPSCPGSAAKRAPQRPGRAVHQRARRRVVLLAVERERRPAARPRRTAPRARPPRGAPRRRAGPPRSAV